MKTEYEAKGILVIPDVFSPEEMEQLKREAYGTTAQAIKNAGYPHQPEEQAYNKRSLIFFPSLANDFINNIRIDARMYEIVKHFLGEGDIKQVNNQIYFREAGDEDQFAWHQDIVFREPRHRFPGIETGYLQTIIAVDDMTIDNGAIEFIDGSHKQGEQEITSSSKVTHMLREFKRMGMQGTKYTAKKGSVLIWTVLTVHGSEANTSNQDRMTYMNGFARAENCLDYPPYAVDGAVVRAINPKLIP
jgi:ectoine hydroxylase-related dioxygenase (phytanoyl-CoA dioxygenase family)